MIEELLEHCAKPGTPVGFYKKAERIVLETEAEQIVRVGSALSLNISPEGGEVFEQKSDPGSNFGEKHSDMGDKLS